MADEIERGKLTVTCTGCGAVHEIDEQTDEENAAPTPVIWECHAPVNDGAPRDVDGELVQNTRPCRTRNIVPTWTGTSATVTLDPEDAGAILIGDAEHVAVTDERA